MMELKIENQNLKDVIEMFYNMSLKGKESRHRTRFVNMIKSRLEGVAEEEMVLLKEHCNLDEEGNPKLINNEYWDIKNPQLFIKDREELYTENYIIDGSNNHDMLETIKNILLNSEIEWSGKQSEIYDNLCEQLEGGE